MTDPLKTPRPARKRPPGHRRHTAGARKRKRLAGEWAKNAGRTRQMVARPARAWQSPKVEVFTPDGARRDFRTGEEESAVRRSVRRAMATSFGFFR